MHTIKRKKYNSKGLGLMELILVIALISILSATTMPLGVRFMQKGHVKNTRDTLISYLNTSKIFALSGKNDNNWGVNVTQDEITLFNGTNYLNRNISLDQDYDIPQSVTITSSEIIFLKESGDTTGGTISINGSEGTSYQITVDTEGNVTVN